MNSCSSASTSIYLRTTKGDNMMAMACDGNGLHKSIWILSFCLMRVVIVGWCCCSVVDVVALANWLSDGKSQNGTFVVSVCGAFHSRHIRRTRLQMQNCFVCFCHLCSPAHVFVRVICVLFRGWARVIQSFCLYRNAVCSIKFLGMRRGIFLYSIDESVRIKTNSEKHFDKRLDKNGRDIFSKMKTKHRVILNRWWKKF